MSFIVSVQKEVETAHIPSDVEFAQWVNLARQNTEPMIELNIRVVSEQEIRKLNKTYRGRDKATNVLSFVSNPPEGVPDANILADIVICADLVFEEAQQFNKPTQDRWAHMVIHGCLHVQGFDHEEEAEREEMEAIERKVLTQLKISDPYQV